MVELGSINGVARPLVSVDVPQGTYTGVSLTYGGSVFAVIDHSGGAGEDDIGHYNIGMSGTPPAPAKLTLNTPLTVMGNAMGLLLNLDIPKSTTFVPYLAGSPNLQPNGGNVTFSPVYSLSAITPAAQPSTLKDGLVEDVHGQVSANSGGALTMTSDTGSVLSFNLSSSTVFAGPSGAAAPGTGDFVDVNAALQQDGSMLATLVQTEGKGLTYAMSGQIIQYSFQQYVQNSGREQQGPNLPNGVGFYSNNEQLGPSTQFEVAWPYGVAETGLPFTPTVSAATLVPGQNVATPSDTLQYIGNVIPVTNTVTLEPQTIDATIASTSTVNGLTTYQVNLFSNDLIALYGPGTSVVVYVTPHTHTITTSALSNGSVGRFRGLLFNDGGTLRMVATEIEDGVTGS